jgi:hypothetical protein
MLLFVALVVSGIATFFGGPGQVIIMATPNRNYEILKKLQLFLEFPFILSQ